MNNDKALSICQRAWEDPGDLFDSPDDMVAIRRWPDGTWVLEEDYKEADYVHMSDDYEVVDVTQEELEELT